MWLTLDFPLSQVNCIMGLFSSPARNNIFYSFLKDWQDNNLASPENSKNSTFPGIFPPSWVTENEKMTGQVRS